MPLLARSGCHPFRLGFGSAVSNWTSELWIFPPAGEPRVIRATEEFLSDGTIKLAKHPGSDLEQCSLEIRYPDGRIRPAVAKDSTVRRVAGGYLMAFQGNP